VSPLNLTELKNEQHKLSRLIVLKDDFSEIQSIAACDIAYTGDKIICSIIVMDIETMKVREQETTISTVRFPYIPGFLSYREAPAIIDTYHKLELEPDILLVDGNGILHPRRMGLACHVGLALDKPCIGVAKSLLCGEVVGNTVKMANEVVAVMLETKEKARPIYVSPGNRISLQTSVDMVQRLMRSHKLPEPLHEAHKTAAKVRRKFREEHNGFVREPGLDLASVA
jgi:deoxyribonuclease V